MIEFGRQTVDIVVRSRIHILKQKVEALKIPDLVLNPNVRCTLRFSPVPKEQ